MQKLFSWGAVPHDQLFDLAVASQLADCGPPLRTACGAVNGTAIPLGSRQGTYDGTNSGAMSTGVLMRQALWSAACATDPSRRFACTFPGCPRRFTRREHAQRHEASHKPEKEYVCEACGKSFARKDNAETHVGLALTGLSSGDCHAVPG